METHFSSNMEIFYFMGVLLSIGSRSPPSSLFPAILSLSFLQLFVIELGQMSVLVLPTGQSDCQPAIFYTKLLLLSNIV